MSMDQSIIVGPYIQGPNFKEVDIPKVKRQCPNHPNKKVGEAKFCPDCGAIIENVDYIDKKKIRMSYVLDKHRDFVDHLFSPNDSEMDDILLPNQYIPEGISIPHDQDSGVEDFTDKNLEAIKTNQMAFFVEKYAAELEVLRKEFGAENIKIRWGVVSYWS